jgi:hypothetical protein
VRAQCDLLAATDRAAFDEHAGRLAILATGLDREWRDQLACPAIAECFARRARGWIASSPHPRSGIWELPEQLRYLEKLTPRTPPEPMAMPPRGGWRLVIAGA